jgi:hypothetical protein
MTDPSDATSFGMPPAASGDTCEPAESSEGGVVEPI